VLTLASASLLFSPGCASKRGKAVGSSATAALSDARFWVLVAAVQTHLFPPSSGGPGAPGAEEINAAPYLRQVLVDPFISIHKKNFIREGAERLQALAAESRAVAFAELTSTQREEVLREFERTMAGRNWIANIMSFLFEALLGDPVYGGNPDQIGWKWLEHRPGYPRPPINKRYFLL